MGLKPLLHSIIDKAPAAKLLKLLGKLSGTMDGKELLVSPESSGQKLVLKGWVKPAKKTAVRYAARWDNPEKGDISYQPDTSQPWQKTTGGRAVAKLGADGLKLKLTFTDLAGQAHAAEFRADIG